MPLIEINDVRIHYHLHGNGEPLVLINGFCGDLYSWKRMMPLLEKRYRLLIFDNRGSGLTVAPEGPFTMERMADDVADLIEALGMNRAHVLGWSMGGNIAQELTLRHPDRVGGLILVSTYTRRPPRSSYVIDAMINTVKEGASVDTFWAMMQSWCLTNSAYRGRESISPIMERQPTAVEVRVIEGFARQKAALDGFDSSGRLNMITAPTLVIHGSEDIMVPPRFGEELAAGIAGAKFSLVQGAGHIIPPKDYSKAVLDFLAKHPLNSLADEVRPSMADDHLGELSK